MYSSSIAACMSALDPPNHATFHVALMTVSKTSVMHVTTPDHIAL